MKKINTLILICVLLPIALTFCPTMGRSQSGKVDDSNNIVLKKETMVAPSLDDYKTMYRVAAAGDQMALVKMLGNGQIYYIPAGARVFVIDSVKIYSSHIVKKIKVTAVEGYFKDSLQGRIFWIDGKELK